MAVSEQTKSENGYKKTLIILSVILAVSVFLNIYQLFYVKQIENEFAILEQKYIEFVEELQAQ